VQVRSLGFATDLAVLRAGGSIVVDADDHLVVRTPSNPGYWWGNFVLVAEPEPLARGVEVFHSEFPDARHVAVGVDGVDGAVPSAAAGLGLEADVSVVLTAAFVTPPRDVDADVRVLSGDGDWDQLLALRRTDDNPAADELYQHRRVEEARRLVGSGAGVFYGAFRDGQLVSTLGVARRVRRIGHGPLPARADGPRPPPPRARRAPRRRRRTDRRATLAGRPARDRRRPRRPRHQPVPLTRLRRHRTPSPTRTTTATTRHRLTTHQDVQLSTPDRRQPPPTGHPPAMSHTVGTPRGERRYGG